VTIKRKTSPRPDIQAITSPLNTEVGSKRTLEMRGMGDTVGQCAAQKSGINTEPIEKRRLL
jgi:hypothetical protein